MALDVDVPGPFGAPVPESERADTLRRDTLNLFDATVVSTASVAPAYSLAATLYLLFTAAGVAYAGPAVILVSFVPVLCIAVAYFHLNRKHPSCGAAFAWLSKVVRPGLGWFVGWVQVFVSVLFCVSAPILAGSNTLAFMGSVGWISQGTASNKWLIAVVGVAWLVVITALCISGIRWTANFQWVLLAIEYLAVISLSIGGIIKVAVSHPTGSTGFHWSWLNPLSIHGATGLAAGVVLGVFFFWGWDTSVNLTEESKRVSRTPGQAGMLAMVLLLGIYLLNIISAQMLLPADEFAKQGPNLLFYFGTQLGGRWFGYVILIAVLSSTVATTQTTLLPAARISLAMARERVFPAVFARISARYRTPAAGTLVLALLALGGLWLITLSPSVDGVYGRIINDIGVFVAFYYGVTGLACAWAYRKVAFVRLGFFFTGILLPLLAGAFLLWVGWLVCIAGGWQSGLADAAPVLIAFALGIPLTLIVRATTKGDFFRVRPEAYTDIGDGPALARSAGGDAGAG
jgi:amino acid transporter